MPSDRPRLLVFPFLSCCTNFKFSVGNWNDDSDRGFHKLECQYDWDFDGSQYKDEWDSQRQRDCTACECAELCGWDGGEEPTRDGRSSLAGTQSGSGCVGYLKSMRVEVYNKVCKPAFAGIVRPTVALPKELPNAFQGHRFRNDFVTEQGLCKEY